MGGPAPSPCPGGHPRHLFFSRTRLCACAPVAASRRPRETADIEGRPPVVIRACRSCVRSCAPSCRLKCLFLISLSALRAYLCSRRTSPSSGWNVRNECQGCFTRRSFGAVEERIWERKGRNLGGRRKMVRGEGEYVSGGMCCGGICEIVRGCMFPVSLDILFCSCSCRM